MGNSVDVAHFRDRRHRGWRRDRALLRLQREQEFERSIRSIYRQVLGIPELSTRAQEIMSPYERQIQGLRSRRLELANISMESEIALRMLHQEVAAIQDSKDEAAIQALLPMVL